MPKLSEILGEHFKQIPEELQDKYKDVDLVDSSTYIIKTDYDSISEQLNTANNTIKELKKNNKDNETLQNTIKEHEKTITDLKTENIRTKKESAIKLALIDAGCIDTDYFIHVNGGVDSFETDELGNIKDLDNIVKSTKESKPYMFPEEQKQPQFSGVNPVDSAANKTTAKDTSKMSYTELCKYLEENPNAQI
ncbi:minor structural protein (endogenous virus) [Clostridium phage phiCT453A]|uniref:head scaffolding protein n=1 Tax=Clostridium phage phiCT453A TaxID=1567012 RepID=UPI0005137519|nr:phage scaffolding protein [Clostridium tetani]YP_009216677.1 head scaffolding protein [Clostridium phage phiCT453A]AJA42523.1 minor structural protein [Clostridium phage phiCT453A]KGI42503.1 hypothetical protein KY55_10510 [Clostridium tetani]RXM58099.1 scaffolding protein [Clostridium tetani]